MFRYNMLFAIALFLSSSSPANVTVFYNGKITTLDTKNPQVDTLVVDGSTIIYTGDRVHAPDNLKSAIQVDLKGRRVLPGFIESHAHFLELGLSKISLNLTGTTSEKQILELVKKNTRKLKKGEWLIGVGWDQNDWQQKAFPTHKGLDFAAPNNPVVLDRIDGHAIWANTAAMKLAAVDKNTKDPQGGRIIRDANGEPTGVFIDKATKLIFSHVPEASLEAKKKAAALAQQEALHFGVTSFHDAGVVQADIDLYKQLYEKKALKLRLYLMLRGSDPDLIESYFQKGPQIGLYDDHLTIRSVKLFADGALGSRGASLLEPYSDETTTKGLATNDETKISDVAKRALASGFQVATHAIGDNANRMVLNAYQATTGDTSKLKQARFRVEHAQIVDPIDIPRFAKLGIIASMQPTHCTSDSPWVTARLGKERAQKSAYVWRSFLENGAHLAFGSDAPVESLNPLLGLYAAVTRKNLDSKTAFYPEQSLTMQEALEAYMLGGAYAEFSEGKKGQLKAGYLADFVVLDKDILNEKPEALLTTKVLQTYVDGEKVYELKP